MSISFCGFGMNSFENGRGIVFEGGEFGFVLDGSSFDDFGYVIDEFMYGESFEEGKINVDVVWLLEGIN